MMSGPSVLLTGSRGFTGRHVRRALESAGYQVFGLVQDSAGPGELAGDLADEASLLAAANECCPDYVIHLAAIAFVAHNNPAEMYRVNLLGTLNLLKALSESRAQLQKVILASTSNVYGSQPIPAVNELCPPSPVSHYAISKLAMEYMARTWMDRLPIVITRPFNYTGQGQRVDFLIPKIVSHYAKKLPSIRLGNLNVVREFNDVRTIAHMYRKLLEDAAPGVTLNLCTGVGHQLLDVLKLMEMITSHHIDVIADPSLTRSNEVPVLIGDPELLQQAVRDAPQFSLRETLEWMLGSYRAEDA